MKILRMNLLIMSAILVFSCSEQKESIGKKSVTPRIKKVQTYTLLSTVKRGQGLFQALKNVSIENELALMIINSLRDEVEFSKLKVGDRLRAVFNEHNKLLKFSFSKNLAESHVVSLNHKGEWGYHFEQKPTEWRTRMIEDELRSGSTLVDDLSALGIGRSVVNEAVNVLLCKVNFRLNAREGDKYKVLLKERLYRDEVIETQVLYTSYSGYRAGNHEAYYYLDAEKGSTYTAHYTQDGQALIRSGLRYPLSSLHIRSGYGYRRHPVTGRRKMHYGVDLRGRRGRPVHSVASGRVVQSTYNKYAGNKVVIKHRDNSKSYYLHLRRRRVNRGDWVIPNQVIGTVGATGRVTGPHLHFGFKNSKGRWMNPMNKRMIATPKLTGDKLSKLNEQIAEIKGIISDIEVSKVTRYLLANLHREVELTPIESFFVSNKAFEKQEKEQKFLTLVSGYFPKDSTARL